MSLNRGHGFGNEAANLCPSALLSGPSLALMAPASEPLRAARVG